MEWVFVAVFALAPWNGVLEVAVPRDVGSVEWAFVVDLALSCWLR